MNMSRTRVRNHRIFSSSIFGQGVAKSISSALILAVFISPFSVIAQEAVVDSPPSEAATPTSVVADPAPTETAATPAVPAESDTAEDSGAAPAGDSADAAELPVEEVAPLAPEEPPAALAMGGTNGTPSTPNPTLFTYQSVAPKVDESSGALTQRIQLSVPPGRNGMQPDITLEYNSQNTQDSVVGYGWSVSIPYIERLNKTGSERLYLDNYFTSSLGGELATTSTATSSPVQYRHKMEDGRFITYYFSNNAWVAYDKNGTKYTFGTTTQAQVYSTSTPSKVYRWMLEEIRDTNNNYVKFVYSSDSNELYPSQIVYTGNGVTDGPMTVDFVKTTRPDPRFRYLGGIPVTTNYRITEISASVSGSWVTKYTLAYASGNNTKRSLLSSVQRSGRDDLGATTVEPVLSFGYISSTTSFVRPSWSGVRNVAHVVADVHGDGVNDVLVLWKLTTDSSDHGDVQLGGTSNSASFGSPPATWAWNTNGPEGFVPDEKGVRSFDINGDGKTDVVQGYDDKQAATTTRKIWLSTYSTSSGYTWSELSSTTWNGTVPIFAGKTADGIYRQSTGLIGDVNGDGIPDYELSLTGYASGSYLGTGSGWVSTSTVLWPVGEMPNTAGVPMNNNQLVDINGDGLDDWVYSSGTTTYVRINTGTGFGATGSEDPRWTIASSTLWSSSYFGTTYYWDRGMRFMDINGDGLVDFVRSYKMPTYSGGGTADIEVGDYKMALLNTGSGWATSSIPFPTPYITQGYLDGGNAWQGDLRYNEYANWMGNGQQYQDVLNQITFPQGASTTVEYSMTAWQGTNPELGTSLLTVSRIRTNDLFGTIQDSQYSYAGGKMYTSAGPREKKFSGFGSITETKAESITKTYFSQNNGVDTGSGEQTDGYYLMSRPYRRDLMDQASNPLKKSFFRWDTKAATSGPTLTFMSSELTMDFDSVGGHKDSAITYDYSTTTGDLLQKNEWGEVTGSTNGTFTDTGADKRSTSIIYASSSTRPALSLQKQATTTNQTGTRVKETKTYYDNLAFGVVGVGNPTKQESWVSGTTYASTTRTYNTYGLVTQEKDPRSNATNYTFDTYNFFVGTSTNALSQTVGYVHDYSSGKVKQKTDENNRVFQTVFDGLDRPLQEKQPDISAPTTLVVKTQYTYTDTPGAVSVQRTSNLDSASSTAAYEYFDGLGRSIQTRSASEYPSTFVVKDTVYDNRGYVQSESYPYFSVNATRSTATSSSLLFKNYVRDALARVTRVTDAVSTTTTAYDKWTTTVTDPNGKLKDITKDAFGNISTVVEHLGAQNLTTSYTWDVLGNLATTTDSLGNVRGFTYDGLSRRTYAQDLHAPADSTYGIWRYTYDLAGNITQQLDPKSQTVNYVYDALNRVTSENYTGQTGTEITYTYDTCTDGKTRLCTVATASATSSYAYNPLGLTRYATTTVSNVNYLLQYAYDRQGNVTDITYPDTSAVRYIFNTAGQPDVVLRKKPGGSYLTAVSVDYAPTGAIAYKSFGNGVVSSYFYDPAQAYRLTRMSTLASSTFPIGGNGGVGGTLGFTTGRSLAISPQSTTLGLVTPQTLSLALLDMIVSTSTLTEAPATTSLSVAQVLPSIESLLVGRVGNEAATIKGNEIAKLNAVARTNRNGYEVEVVSMNPIEGGVEVFARAWDGWGNPIGFGPDGSVEIERFRFINPPILVSDSEGAIVRTWKDSSNKTRRFTYREDPREALLQSLVHTISVKSEKFGSKNIVAGKVGNTTSVFYSAAGTSSPMDAAYRAQGTNYNSVNTAGSGDVADRTATAIELTNTFYGGTYYIWRAAALFNTTVLGTSTISAATLSLFGCGCGTNGNANLDSVGVYGVQPLSTSTAALSDFGTFGTSSRAATGTTYALWTDGAYNDIALNSAGIAAISTTTATTTKFGIRTVRDAMKIAPTGVNQRSLYLADQSGTTNDPKLIVESNLYVPPPPPEPGGPSTIPYGDIQNSVFTYDPAGNITQIVDTPKTGAAKTVQFVYDDLNRLLQASTTVASSSPYRLNYSYNELGNITYAGTTTQSSVNSGSISILDASNQYAYHADAAVYDITGDLTIEAWVKPLSFPSDGMGVVSKFREFGDTGPNAYTFGISSSTAMYFGSELYVATVNISGTISSTTWSHVAAVYDPATMKAEFYLNGLSVGTTTAFASNPGDSAGRYRVGAYNSVNDGVFNGLIDDVRLWNVKRTASQLVANKNMELTGSESNLKAYYKLNNTYDDSTANANTLTAVNSPSFSSDVPFAGTGSPTYLYAGTSYANPHAPTTINGVTLTYDRNGNLATSSPWQYYWDYRNRLTQVATGTATSTYAYDHTNQRVRQVVGNTTTIYPNKYWNVVGATTTAYLYLGDSIIATVEADGRATTTRYIHPDYLNSTNVVTNSSGTPMQVIDYLPYGGTRYASSTNSTNEKHQFIGQYTDSTGMSYLNARYLVNTRGQFLSQDPVFWEMGLTNDGKSVLINPQAQNSYAYAGGNPIINKDPSGRFWWTQFYTDWNGYSGLPGIAMKAGEVLGGRFAAQDAIAANASNIAGSSAQSGVSPAVYQAIMYEENAHQLPPFGGERGAENLSPGSFGGGVGVMQVSGGTSGLANSALINDKTNVYSAGSILGGIKSKHGSSPSVLGAYYNSGKYGPANKHANLYGKRINSYTNTSLAPTLGDRVVRAGAGAAMSTGSTLSAMASTLTAISSILKSMSK